MKVQYKNEKEKDRLKRLIDTICIVPEGAAMVALAKKRLDVIRFNDTLKRGNLGNFKIEDGCWRSIELNPRATDVELLSTLLHEMRHMWQDTQMDFRRWHELTPKDAMLFTRLKEGDANAFAAAVVTDIRRKTGINIPRMFCGFVGIRNWLAGKPRDREFVRERVFKNFQVSEGLQAKFYYRLSRKAFLQKTYDGRTLKQATPGGKSLCEVFKNAASTFSHSDEKGVPQLYMGAKNMDELSARILRYVPIQPKQR